MQIGSKTIEAMKAMAGEQIDTYAGKINTAFLKSTDKLKVSLTFDIGVSATKTNALDLDVTISFTESKVKEKVSTTVMENQVDLSLGSTVYKIKGE